MANSTFGVHSDSESLPDGDNLKTEFGHPPTSPDPNAVGPASNKMRSPSVSLPVERAWKGDDVDHAIELGLGRGLDATNPTPWLNKTSFQVRRVCFEEVVGTEEGGAQQSYVNEIETVQTQRIQLKESITYPQLPLTIGVDAEMSRSTCTSRRSVGKKVVNRTISYREDLDDLPLRASSDPAKVQQSLKREVRKSSHVAAATLPTFEERLSKWIYERLTLGKPAPALPSAESRKVEGDPPPTESSVKGNATDTSFVNKLTMIVQNGTQGERDEIIEACREFVSHFRITHYVSAIELGAAVYVVMSTSEYQSKMAMTKKLGFDKIAGSSVSATFTSKKSHKSKNTKSIGAFNAEGKVDRRTYGEAVVGVRTQPVSRLVRMRFLQLALQLALVEFIEKQTHTTDGPFIIACNNDEHFLKVNDNHTVTAITERGEASPFFIMKPEDRDNPHEFVIAYYGEYTSEAGAKKEHKISRYLEAPVNIFGHQSGPLQIKDNVKVENSRFVLRDRLHKHLSSVEVASWVTGNEVYYVKCSRRKFAHDGYLAVKMVQTRPRAPRNAPHREAIAEYVTTYNTACVPSTGYHNSRDLFMLFHLLPHGEHQPADRDTPSDQTKDITAKLNKLQGIREPPSDVHQV